MITKGESLSSSYSFGCWTPMAVDHRLLIVSRSGR